MKKLLFSLVILFLVINAAFGQVPEPITGSNTGVIVGGAGVLKFAGGNPNAIASIRVINEKQFSSYAWDTTTNRMWQYSRKLAVGSRWKLVPVIEYSNGTPTTNSRDTAYKFVVDTIFRKAYICNQVGCVEIGASAAVTVVNGISLSGSNAVQLGGVLSQPTTIFTDATNVLKVRGLVSTLAGDSIVTVDPFTGQLRRRDGTGLMTNSAALGMFKTKIEYDFDTAITNAEMRNNINYVSAKMRDTVKNVTAYTFFSKNDARGNMYVTGDSIKNEILATGSSHDGSELNTAFGTKALLKLTTGFANTALGNNALGNMTSAAGNTAVGNASLTNNTDGYANTAMGNDALASNTTGHDNVAIGMHVGGSFSVPSSGSRNVFIGTQIAKVNYTTASDNNFIGANSGYHISTASFNVCQGSSTGFSMTTGINNVFFGHESGTNVTTASNNSFLGYRSGYQNITGYNNTSTGSYSMFSNTGVQNTAFGFSSLFSNTAGGQNVAVGNNAMYNNVTGSNNVAIGNSAGFNSLGNNNIFIGSGAGSGSTSVTDDDNIIVGNSVTAILKGKVSGAELTIDAKLTVNRTPVYADNAAAIAGGLAVDRIYRTPTGDLKIVYTP